MTGRLAALLTAVVLAVVTTAGPGLADPATPTNYESTVTGIEPSVAGVEVEVTGGDSFLHIAVDQGTSVVVPGYSEEPYLRIDANGEVYVNRRSPAFWLNDDRYGQSTVPPDATPESEPEWERVAGGGQWAWHDHRIHWMSPDTPPSIQAQGTEEVFRWTVPIEVDETPAEVVGVLTWYPSETPLPWVALLVFAGAIAVLIGRLGTLATGIVVTVAGAASLLVSLSQASITPPGAGGELVSQGAAGLATLAGLVTVLLRGFAGRRRLDAVGDLPALLGAVLLVVWGSQRFTGIWLPVLPTPLPVGMERLALSLTLGAAIGVVIVGFMRRLVWLSPPSS